MDGQIFEEKPPKEEEPKTTKKEVSIPKMQNPDLAMRSLVSQIKVEKPIMVREVESLLVKTLSKYSKATPEEVSKFLSEKIPMYIITYLDVVLLVLNEKEAGAERSFKLNPIIPKIDKKKADKLASELQKGLLEYNPYLHVEVFSEGKDVKIMFSIVPPKDSNIDLKEGEINP